jgi:hypothetical protein
MAASDGIAHCLLPLFGLQAPRVDPNRDGADGKDHSDGDGCNSGEHRLAPARLRRDRPSR